MAKYDTKVPAPAGKPTVGKVPSQSPTGKLSGMTSMGTGGSDAKKGGPIRTVPSNPIDGKTQSSGTAMGGNGVIKGFV